MAGPGPTKKRVDSSLCSPCGSFCRKGKILQVHMDRIPCSENPTRRSQLIQRASHYLHMVHMQPKYPREIVTTSPFHRELKIAAFSERNGNCTLRTSRRFPLLGAAVWIKLFELSTQTELIWKYISTYFDCCIFFLRAHCVESSTRPLAMNSKSEAKLQQNRDPSCGCTRCWSFSHTVGWSRLLDQQSKFPPGYSCIKPADTLWVSLFWNCPPNLSLCSHPLVGSHWFFLGEDSEESMACSEWETP